jgi:uncharacterized membrane protein
MTTRPSVPSLNDTMSRPAFLPKFELPRPGRLDSVDVLRGLVMIIMMLDHTRDFVNAEAFQFDPTDLAKTNGFLFFTRWITHFCAPVFVFLAGTSVYLQKMRGKPVRELSKFLVKRGLWLILLELTVVKFAMWFNVIPTYLATLQVIWVIGVSLIVLAGLVRLPLWVAGLFGVAMIVLHNLTDGIQVPAWTGPGPAPSATAKLWIVLHQGGPMPVAGWPSPVVLVLYALIPWVGVAAAGYAFGRVYEWPSEKRRKLLVQLGAGCIAAFVALRTINLYGDPSHWSSQSRTAMTIASFFNVTKYPPSLLFLLMTLGPGILALAAFESWRRDSRIKRILATYGRVPLFYYIMQWITAHGAAVLLGLLAGKSVGYLFMNPPDIYTKAPRDAGFPLWATWLVWLVGVALLYPLCKWYGGVKARRKDWWISYT